MADRYLGFIWFTPSPTGVTSEYYPRSEKPYKADIVRDMRRAHAMIGRAEALLWPGRRPSASVAILVPRSSYVWDNHTHIGMGDNSHGRHCHSTILSTAID
jgi:hypothetical protein